MKNRTEILFFCMILLLNISSCKNIFAPRLENFTDKQSLYNRFLKTPGDVLENFRYAYIYRDSLIYSTLIDSDFVFIYYNADDEGGSGHYDSWLREVELRTTGRIFRAFSYIDLTWNSTLDSSFSYYIKDSLIIQKNDIFEEANIANISKSFELNLGYDIIIEGNAKFDFVKNNNEWQIYRWRDESSSY